jgi:hypothetical protein
MGEIKTLNLRSNFLQDIMLLISIASFVLETAQTGGGMAKLHLFSRNLQKYVWFFLITFLGATLQPD